MLLGNSTRPAARSQVGQLAFTAIGTVTLAVFAGVLVGLPARAWWALVFVTALALWVGGAVSGQVLLGSLLDRGRGSQVMTYLRLLIWIIPRLYVTSGTIAVAAGLVLVQLSGAAFAQPEVIVPLALYGLLSMSGAGISAPGYARISRDAEQLAADPALLRRRLLPLAWLNRIELVIVIGVAFVLIADLL